MKLHDRRGRALSLAGWLVAVGILAGIPLSCGGGGGGGSRSSNAPVPFITSINGSSDPASPTAVSIEINGQNLGAQPGEVHFTDVLDPANFAIVVPIASGWTDTSIVAAVPDTGAVATFPIPGAVTVTVVTGGLTSNGVDLDLVDTPTFSVNNVTWQAATPLPTPTTGLGAAAIRVDDTTAFMVVAGGFDGAANLTTVLSNSLNQDGSLGPAWTTETNSLPFPRAHHGMVEANPGNAPLLDLNDRFVYVIGGQQDPLDAPGGTTTVYMSRVSNVTGNVGVWTQTAALPEAISGPAVTVYNGHVYLVGGLRGDGTPTDMVLSSPIASNGTLGAWVQSADPYPMPISFATAFGFGGSLYVLGGDSVTSLDPNEQGGAGEKGSWRAPAQSGVVGSWLAESGTIKGRKKHITWSSFGQMIAAEGVYGGGPGSQELERSSIQPDGSLASWSGMTSGSNQINANVYNAAAVLSPIRVFGGAPRFILFGGQGFVGSPPGAISDAVYYNNAP